MYMYLQRSNFLLASLQLQLLLMEGRCGDRPRDRHGGRCGGRQGDRRGGRCGGRPRGRLGGREGRDSQGVKVTSSSGQLDFVLDPLLFQVVLSANGLQFCEVLLLCSISGLGFVCSSRHRILSSHSCS